MTAHIEHGWIGRSALDGSCKLLAKWSCHNPDGDTHKPRWRWLSYGRHGVTVITCGSRAECEALLESSKLAFHSLPYVMRPKKSLIDASAFIR